MKITTIVAGPKPLKLLSSGETKKTFEVKCQGLYENGLGRYKATLTITGPDEELAEELLDTLDLGEEFELKCLPPKKG
ncbi:hypothetical protein [Mesotoga prima]|jgi:hypothetical protein|uniref:hypothetical protein n=1 Tax=Mesotoga prima TaxID=1184387 RepID=UPI001A0ABC8B|nr:hypothetical protein [Magnetococcales bacterium]